MTAAESERPDRIHIRVGGLPAPGGSKVGVRNKQGHVVGLRDAAGQRNKNWRASCALCAQQVMQDEERALCHGPLKVNFDFYMQRPKAHFRSGKYAGEIKNSAPLYPDKKPDRTKLMRSTEDALTGVVWHDDAQIVDGYSKKHWASDANPPGCAITVVLLDELDED